MVAELKKWMDENDFSDYEIVQYRSLFWPVPTKANIKMPGQIPQNLGERFYKLFQTLLDKRIYLSPNAYEVGFGSSAHDSKVLEDFKSRLWS